MSLANKYAAAQQPEEPEDVTSHASTSAAKREVLDEQLAATVQFFDKLGEIAQFVYQTNEEGELREDYDINLFDEEDAFEFNRELEQLVQRLTVPRTRRFQLRQRDKSRERKPRDFSKFGQGAKRFLDRIP